jgi:hypothetical protein
LYYTNPCLNWFGRELSVVCRHISSIGDKLDRKGQQNSNFLVTHSIWMQFFFWQNNNLYRLLVDHTKLAILFLTGAEISHICREYLTLKIVKRQISKIHRVQHNTVTTCSISPLSTCYDRIMLRCA